MQEKFKVTKKKHKKKLKLAVTLRLDENSYAISKKLEMRNVDEKKDEERESPPLKKKKFNHENFLFD